MSKTSISLSIDKDVLDNIEKRSGRRSETINESLKWMFCTVEGLDEQIAYHTDCIEQLEKKKELMGKSRQKRIDNVTKTILNELVQVKQIIKKDPSKLSIWVRLINTKYNKCYNEDELLEIMGNMN